MLGKCSKNICSQIVMRLTVINESHGRIRKLKSPPKKETNPGKGAKISVLVGAFFTNPSWKICPLNWVHLPQGSGFGDLNLEKKRKETTKAKGTWSWIHFSQTPTWMDLFDWKSGPKIKVIQVSKTKIQVQSDQNMVAYIGKPRGKVYIHIYIYVCTIYQRYLITT